MSDDSRDEFSEMIEEIIENVQQMFDGFDTSQSENPFNFNPPFAGPQRTTSRMEIREEEDQYLLMADVPGFKESELEVTVNATHVAVRGESSGENQSRVIEEEVHLGRPIEEDEAVATLTNGVLTIELPYEQDEDSVAVDIET